MKLLLTSAGITNKKIGKALLELAGKKAEELHVAFIPTAVNVDGGNKKWFIDNLEQLNREGYKVIDIVDISALPKNIWLPRLEAADVLFFSGGNSPHLMHSMEKSGLKEILPELLKTRVYASISAGSVIVSPTLALSNPKKVSKYKEKFDYRADGGLGFVDFYIRPHYNSPHFPHAQKEALALAAKTINKPLYALDDQMAIRIEGNNIELVGEGEYFVFNT